MRLFAVLALVALLDDAGACLSFAYALAPQTAGQEELSVRAPCPCGCPQHQTALAGVGLAQLAAPPAVLAPREPRGALAVFTPSRDLPNAPPRAIDHVPIASA